MKELITLFEAYLLQLQGQLDQAEDRLQKVAANVLEKERVPSVSAWLWVFVEHVERSSHFPLLERYGEQLEQAISLLTDRWNQPSPNIWGEDDDIIHISNLGMIYGSLNAAKRITGRAVIQKTLTAIRDYVFDHGLAGGMLIRSPQKKEVSTDLLATVMPFGLFSPEDLVMVEAVKEMEQRLVADEEVFPYRGAAKASPVSAAWLAWYFAEKGDARKARGYAGMAEKSLHLQGNDESMLAEVLLKIVHCYLEQSVLSAGDFQIIHTPVGNDNPYEKLNMERCPRDPEVEQEVRVQAQIWPEQEDAEVFVKVETAYRRFEVSCSRIEKGNERIWEASIGSFTLDEEANYSFIVRKGDQELKKGSCYSFMPLARNQIVSIELLGQEENTVWFKGNDKFSRGPVYLGISKENEAIRILTQFGQNPCPVDGLSVEKSLLYKEDANAIAVSDGSWVCSLEKSPFQIQVTDEKGKILLKGYDSFYPVFQWWINHQGDIHKAGWNFHTPFEERFYGLGERYNRLELRGERLDCYVYNQYRDQGNRTYMPVPFYMSSKGYGLFVDMAFYSEFDFGTQLQDLLSFSSHLDRKAPKLTFKVLMGQPKEINQKFTNITGKPVLPPAWAFGPWMSSNNWDRDSLVRKQVEETNKYKIPSTVLVIEQWSDEATYYIFNDAEYEVKPGNKALNYEDYTFPEWGRWPDPKGLFDYLHDHGLKVILWQIPIQKYLNRQSHRQKDEDERYMLEQGFMVKKADGTPYRMPEGWFKESLLMDFSNADGSRWWFDKRKYLLEIGVDGFKTDGGEFVFGRDLCFSDGRKGAEMRNLYPNDYIKAYYDFAATHHQGNALTFSRAGFTGAQNFPAHWAGDERSTFDAFRHSLIAGLSSGISGIPFWGWDLAGFNGDIPTAELFVRSAQMAAFCPIMQYHAESKGEFNQDRTPWNIAERTGDKRALEGYRFFANVRMNLLPYIYDQARRTSHSGIPLMRALFVEYPEDPRCHAIYDEYMFGDDLLVAPIIEEGETERMVYFPEGLWTNLWSSEMIQGPVWRRVRAPLMDIPVFVKQGSVLLLNCDETLALGSWVGNSVESYKVPVLRLYPLENIKRVIRDHLNQEWIIEAVDKEDQWHMNIKGKPDTRLMVPKAAVKSKETLVVNGVEKRWSDFDGKNGHYVIPIT